VSGSDGERYVVWRHGEKTRALGTCVEHAARVAQIMNGQVVEP
jgi:hypothetical protein